MNLLFFALSIKLLFVSGGQKNPLEFFLFFLFINKYQIDRLTMDISECALSAGKRNTLIIFIIFYHLK